MDYQKINNSIMRVITSNPQDSRAYADMLSLCRSWEEEDFAAAHKANEELRKLCAKYDTEEVEESEEQEDEPIQKPGSVAVGDIVTFNGTTHYASANSSKAVSCRPGKARVTQIYPTGKHPYHLVRVSGGTSNVYGWVDAADIWELGQTEEESFEVGDIVEFTGNTHYTTANASQGKPHKSG